MKFGISHPVGGDIGRATDCGFSKGAFAASPWATLTIGSITISISLTLVIAPHVINDNTPSMVLSLIRNPEVQTDKNVTINQYDGQMGQLSK